MESSVFGNRLPGDCYQHGKHAIIYDGTSTTVPTLDKGVIVFGGGISTEEARGIGVNGTAAAGVYRLDYDSIKNGGTGTRKRGSVDPLAKKVQMACKKKKCGEAGDLFYLEVREVQTCQFPITNWQWYPAFEVAFECNCLETCCQRLSALVDQINQEPAAPVTAAVTNVGSDWFITLTAKNAGQDFIVLAHEGLTEPKELVPYYKQQLTAAEVAKWFPNRTIPLLRDNPTKKMTVYEIYSTKKIPSTRAVGVATSNEMGDIYVEELVDEITLVVFDTATTQSNTALSALETILTGTNAYNRKLDSTTVVDRAYYRYLITRTDAGDAAALTAVRADSAYTSNQIQLDRSAYYGGKSYYTLITTSATPPTAASGDTVTQGQFVPDDLPVTISSCPEPESSVCLNC